MTSIDTALRKAVDAWIDDDPDDETRLELATLLTEDREDELADRFSGPLRFGTAGLRGMIGGGPNRMNRVVVARATAGLCAWLLEQVPDARVRGICIAYDGRKNSRVFAEDVAEVVCGAGIKAFIFEEVAPTPLLAFSVLDRGAAGGVMVTASHNPPEYNGYKVYWDNGAQIIPPHDHGIAERIAAVESVSALPRMSRADSLAAGRLELIGPAMTDAYLEGLKEKVLNRSSAIAANGGSAAANISVAYTALHGVGEHLARKALGVLPYVFVHSVGAQAEPDGRFPTVRFPNPEEDGAMDLVLDLAREENVDLALANDPDADRLAVAVRDANGHFVMLSGDDVGCLLAHYLLSEGSNRGKRVVINTVVSSPLLGAIAAAHDCRWEQTLTGFKWIANRSIVLAPTESTVIGYEEALGYSIGDLVRDKDGISAAVVMTEFATRCKARGTTIHAEREAMWRRYGLFLSRSISVVFSGADFAERIDVLMDEARSDPPAEIAGAAITAVDDYRARRRRCSSGDEVAIELPESNLLGLDVAGGHRILLRPSGTEPKLKHYFHARVEIADGESVAAARIRGEALLDRMEAGFAPLAKARTRS